MLQWLHRLELYSRGHFNKNARCIRIENPELDHELDLPWHASGWLASGCLELTLACLFARRALKSLDARTGRAHPSREALVPQNAAPIADRRRQNVRGPGLDAFATERSKAVEHPCLGRSQVRQPENASGY